MKPGAAICEVAAANYLGMCSSEDIDEVTECDGVLYPNSRVRLTDITDGTSQTFAVSERLQRHGQVTWAGSVPGAAVFASEEGVWLDGNTAMTLGYAGEANKPGEVGGGWASSHHTSAHGVGANFLFCDGHVTFLTPSINFATFKALTTRARGEVINADY
jgi:prepilin-type processing-associated H-X9-DG protein